MIIGQFIHRKYTTIRQHDSVGNFLRHDPLIACIMNTSVFLFLLLLALPNYFASPIGHNVSWWMYLDFILNFATKVSRATIRVP
jgi:hypothetical protein